MKARLKKNLGLKLLLFMLLGLNMSWFHDFVSEPGSNTDLASETANSYSYDRNVSAPSGDSHKWKANITQVTQTRTDVWGNVDPEGKTETAYKWSARLEGCYGLNCRINSPGLIRAKDLGMSEADFNNKTNIEAVLARIQEKYDPEIDTATGKRIDEAKAEKKRQEEEAREAALEEKKEKEIAACKRNEEGDTISGYEALSCRARKLGNRSGEELDLEFADIAGEIRAYLSSSDPLERKRGEALLKAMGTSGYSRSINAQLRAMRAGAAYLDQYTTEMRTFMTTTNPMIKQMSLGKLTMLNQRYQMDSYGVAFNPDAATEFSYWQEALDRNLQAIVTNPSATNLPGFSGSGLGPALPGTLNVNNRLLRGNTADVFYNRDQWFGAQVTAPQNWQQYLTVNPYVNQGGRTNGLTIPQINQRVTGAGLRQN
ncbi:MAG: hypothetical protein H6624_19355 [Bdellovibrionaceae bacterium]|nr:hypothetical protein [Bdellovibrionales bacterium]MCB9086507.1 hypothetical protein [Pseudobdellovibrionaceae bacterium]